MALGRPVRRLKPVLEIHRRRLVHHLARGGLAGGRGAWPAFQEREQAGSAGAGSLALAAAAGLLTGVGGLSRYAFAWMILPVLLFVALAAPRRRGRLCAAAAACFLLVMGPWVARNFFLSGTCFGTAGYALVQQTPAFPQDTLERSFDPRGGLRRVEPLDVVDKFLSNAREMWRDDLPRLGGNWVSAFFLVGLLIPFRNPALGRMRVFLLCALALLFVAQAAGRTHLTSDAPEINSENLLVLAAPLVFVFGAALFFTLMDQLNLATVDARGAVVGAFILLTCAPLLMTLLIGHGPPPESPYVPPRIQWIARWLRADELMVSDIPGAMAWYGDRQCGWLPLDDDQEFFHFNGLKPIKAVYLTERTTNERFLSQMMAESRSWGISSLSARRWRSAHRLSPQKGARGFLALPDAGERPGPVADAALTAGENEPKKVRNFLLTNSDGGLRNREMLDGTAYRV